MRTLLLFLFLICAHSTIHAEELCEASSCNGESAKNYSGKVVAVLDGDTVLLLRGSERPFKVRLANIDAPEKAQEYGMPSKQSLAELVLRKQVQVNTRAVDSYGRVVAMISENGRDINQEQVRRGMAWADSRSRANKMLDAQHEAKEARRGLWAQRNPLQPSQWRKAHAALPQHAAQDPACVGKHYCSQMSSCEEAKFYFVNCGVKSLDSDGDGAPCEKLCAAHSSPAIESIAK